MALLLVTISGETFGFLESKIRSVLVGEWGVIRIAYGKGVPFTMDSSITGLVEEHCLTIMKVYGKYLVTRMLMSDTGKSGCDKYVVRQEAFDDPPTFELLRDF